MLEQILPGREFEVWPLHITIVPWFPCDDPERLDKQLRGISHRHKSFTVKLGETETWGKKEKFDVVIVDDPGQLHRLHWDVLQTLEKNGFFVHQKDFLGTKYKPHVTIRNHKQMASAAYKAGDTVKIKSFASVKQIRLKKSGRMIKSIKEEYLLS